MMRTTASRASSASIWESNATQHVAKDHPIDRLKLFGLWVNFSRGITKSQEKISNSMALNAAVPPKI